MGSRTAVARSLAFTLALGVVAGACSEPIPLGRTPPTVTVIPSEVTLGVLDTVRFQAQVSGAAVTLRWVSSAPDVASVDSTGLAMALSLGTAVISAVSGDLRGNAMVSVLMPADLSPDTAFVVVGKTVQLHATFAHAGSDAVVWSSADTTIATVSDSGLVAGVGFGKTRVTVSLGDVSAAAWVYVSDGSGIGGTFTNVSLTQSGTGVPVDSAGVAGSVDATLSYKMGGDTGSVRLLVDQDTVCGRPVGYGEASVTCTLNTTGFDSASGAVAFANGPHTLRAELFDAAGDLWTTAQRDVAFANVDTELIRVAGAGTTTDSTGATWQTGDLTATSIPVLYSGAAVDSARFTLEATEGGVTVSVSAVGRDPSTGLSVTFPALFAPAQGGTSGLRDAAATVVVTMYEAGGATITARTPPFAYDAQG